MVEPPQLLNLLLNRVLPKRIDVRTITSTVAHVQRGHIRDRARNTRDRTHDGGAPTASAVVPIRAQSSIGQSPRLITGLLQVRALLGPLVHQPVLTGRAGASRVLLQQLRAQRPFRAKSKQERHRGGYRETVQ